MAQDLSPGKSFCILAIVVGCFAILWPSIFYPMLKGSIFPSSDNGNKDGCCQVLSYKDVNGIKLVTELCHSVLKQSEKFDIITNRLDTKAIERCRSMINATCGVDIKYLLKDKVHLDPTYTSTLEELRTVNKSFCLKYHFEINLDLLGAPHRLKTLTFTSPTKFSRQERSPYIRPNAIHPALRERGRAVPQPHAPPKPQRERSSPPPPVIAAKKPPIPGMRPPMGGGGGHLPSQKGSGPMGILMPLYTVGIVIFFAYTVTKLICRKQDNNSQYIHDPDFCRLVFQNNANESKQSIDEKRNGSISTDSSKLGWQENDIRDIEINRLRKRLAETEATMERIVNQMNLVSRSLINPLNENLPQEENNLSHELNAEILQEKQTMTKKNRSEVDDCQQMNGLIQVVGMEMSESCENGQPWKHSTAESTNKCFNSNRISEDVADEILLPANVPLNSQILVSDASTRSVIEEPSVILESKVTLNVISNNSKHQEEEDVASAEDDIENDDDEGNELNENDDSISENGSVSDERRNSFEREGVPSTEL